MMSDWYMRSPPAISASTEVFFTRFSAWFAKGGRMMRKVWGKMM